MITELKPEYAKFDRGGRYGDLAHPFILKNFVRNVDTLFFITVIV